MSRFADALLPTRLFSPVSQASASLTTPPLLSHPPGLPLVEKSPVPRNAPSLPSASTCTPPSFYLPTQLFSPSVTSLPNASTPRANRRQTPSKQPSIARIPASTRLPLPSQPLSNPAPPAPLLSLPPGLPLPSVEPVVASLATSPPEKLTTPVFTALPTFDEILPFLSKSIISARRIPSYATSTWKETAQACWSSELTRLATVFDNAMLDPTPIKLFNAVFSFVCAPGMC